jgi:uncharacterized protein (DUF1810 family)
MTAILRFKFDLERSPLCFTDAQNSIKKQAVFALNTETVKKSQVHHLFHQWAAGGAASALNQYAIFGTLRKEGKKWEEINGSTYKVEYEQAGFVPICFL